MVYYVANGNIFGVYFFNSVIYENNAHERGGKISIYLGVGLLWASFYWKFNNQIFFAASASDIYTYGFILGTHCSFAYILKKKARKL